MTLSVSVIIPTLNGEKWLDSLLAALHKQTLAIADILLVDSGSTDNTLHIARRYKVKIHTIEGRDFDHGTTRTLAAGLVTGDILVYMTQDAIPTAKDSLQRLIQPLAEEQVAAAYGRQLPAKDANVFSEHLRLFNYPDQSQIRCWQDRKRFGFKTIFISNSFAAYRRDVLAAHGFFPAKQLFGEDTLTVAKLIENGYCVAYVSEACVWHSHNYSITQDFKRYFDIGVFHVEQSDQLSKFGGPGGAGRKYVLSELSLLCSRKEYALLPESLLRNFGKFVAYTLGNHYRRLPRWFAARLSMHRNWWNT
ncbi:MAG: glycosyltransferase family 2 protein [Desulfobulbus sp.]|nr:MAG: glycosyltransferase family 2 protein [Desulfobulbus sp.]